ncbi:MAG: hypothetical protein O7C75_11080 [Verrucomicrobia bacterium]|nr:hypothetical protein [Verrucomicrobiota bacterium]
MEEDLSKYHDLTFRPVELLVLEDRWNNGKLQKYVPLVERFIEKRQEEIKNAAGPNPDDESVARGIIQLVLSNGSLDHAAEMLDQMEEISREIWIRGEQGDYDRLKITLNWTKNCAPSWRRWRILKYTFVAVKCSVEIYRSLESNR